LYFSQDINSIINVKEVERVERKLSADDMQGRVTFSAGIEKAADFISDEFKAMGLHTWNNGGSYRQPLVILKSKFVSASGEFDGQPIDGKNIVSFTSTPDLMIDAAGGYQKVFIKAGESFIAKLTACLQRDKNYLVLVDTSFSKNFSRLRAFAEQQFKSEHDAIFVLTVADPQKFTINSKQQIAESKPTSNIIGVLPGKSKKDEYVIFSGHYDHLGIGKPNDKNDSIYNGANDDASGTTAVIMLAKYFSQLKDNERTLLFVAFTAEESGGYGSEYFSRQLDPAKVMAMFNIEMIGTESKWGNNSAYLSGYEKTDMGKILEKNLSGSRFRFYPDPYPEQQLFFRSDNATLARQGVPAHSISTSKMDSEKYYHTLGDEIETLDLKNMTEIIKAIAISSKSIVEGNDTPTRVKEQ